MLLMASILPSAYAQSPEIPSSAETGRLRDQLFVPTPREQSDIVRPDDLLIDENIPDAIDGFVLNKVDVQGVTVFDKDYFNDLIAEYIEREVDITVLNHLAARITQAYRDEGYFLSRAILPQQEIIGGEVKIQVIEGRVGNVIIDDPEHILAKDDFRIVSKTADKIKAVGLFHGPTLERYILLLNDSAGISVQSLLQEAPSTAEPGTVDIVLRIDKEPRQISVSYDNHGSRFVGPHQLSAAYLKGNVMNSFDQLTLQTSVAVPFSEVTFGAIEYSLPLTEEGLTASVSLSYANSEPGLALRALEVEGDSVTIESSLSYPVIRLRSESLTIGGVFTLRQSATEFLDEEFIDDKTRVLSFFGDYETQDSWGGLDVINLTFSKGLDFLDATETGDDNLSREQGRSDFIKVGLEASRQQDFFPHFQLINAVNAQYTPYPLLSSEEFGYGGTTFGRAYDPSELTGDQGVSTSVELLYTSLDPVPELDLKLVPFAFYDIGKVWNHDAGSKPVSGASAGFGTYYDFSQRVSGAVQVAYPLTRTVDTPVMNGPDGPRILFSLSTSF